MGKRAFYSGLIGGVASTAIGVGLVARADTAFGMVWSAVFVVAGVVTVISAVAAARGVYPVDAVTYRAGVVVLALLAGWCAAAGVVSAIQEHWSWGLVMAFPFAYLVLALRGAVRAEAQRRAG